MPHRRSAKSVARSAKGEMRLSCHSFLMAYSVLRGVNGSSIMYIWRVDSMAPKRSRSSGLRFGSDWCDHKDLWGIVIPWVFSFGNFDHGAEKKVAL